MLDYIISCLVEVFKLKSVNSKVAIGKNVDNSMSVILSINFPVDTDAIENIFNGKVKLHYMLKDDFDSVFKSGSLSIVKANYKMFQNVDEIKDEDIRNIVESELLKKELSFKCDIW